MISYVCGIDIGTSSVKVLILRNDGNVVSKGSAALPAPIINGLCREQDANIWWNGVSDALKNAISDLVKAGGNPKDIGAISVDATSGTIVPVDKNINPTFSGIMYNDARSANEANIINEKAYEFTKKLGYKFNASFALPKIMWLKNNVPEIFENTKYILHQADFITMKLTNLKENTITDASNALKTGYDILENKWPDYFKDIGIEKSLLPEVRLVGDDIGIVDKNMADVFGLPYDCRVVAGMTDSIAACVASGASKVGDMNTTLGSTIVWKILSKNLVCDAQGRLYSRLHPAGVFLPGGAGNAGGQGIRSMLDVPTEELNKLASELKVENPSEYFAYPIPSKGERYPFLDSEFKPFSTAPDNNLRAKYQSLLEGAACIERMGYEVAVELGASNDGVVWTTGTGAMIDSWMQIRANMLNRVVSRAKHPESAYGSALVAAMNLWYNKDFNKAATNLIFEDMRFEPDEKFRKEYDEYYQKFCDNLKR